MKAMLLAAGAGERLRPLSRTHPKPVIPVLGRPLALQILHRLLGEGVREAIVNLHHQAERIRETIGEGEVPGLPLVRYSHEEQLLGTAGGLRKAAALLKGDGPIVVWNCDALADVDLAAAVAQHRASGALATLVLVPARTGYTVVRLDEGGRVVSFDAGTIVAPGAQERYLFTGIHLIEERLLDRIPEGARDIVRDVYGPLLSAGAVSGYLHGGFWWEFGSPELYVEGSLRLLDCDPELRRRITRDHDPVRRVGSAIVAVGAGSDLHAASTLRGRVALGFASHVSEGARLEDAIILPEAWIGPRCNLCRVVVDHGVELPAGFEAMDAIVCTDPAPEADPPVNVRRVGNLLVHGLCARGVVG